MLLYHLGPPAQTWFSPQWARPSHFNLNQGDAPTDVLTDGFDLTKFLVESLSSHMTLVSVLLTKLLTYTKSIYIHLLHVR